VAISYDSDKRLKALTERGLDFEDAKYVFEGPNLEVEDIRNDYGEVRIACYGLLKVEWWLLATRRVARIAMSSA
jgi:hypothetical protein